MTFQAEIIALLFSAAMGAALGLERELRGKPAGIRTMILVSVGSTLFTIFSRRFALMGSDPSRVAAQIVTGIGFLGAGAILHDRSRVSGLTTAASIWLMASIGIGAAVGAFQLTIVAVGLMLLTLIGFARVEHWLDERRHTQSYELVMKLGDSNLEHLQKVAKEDGLTFRSMRSGKNGELLKLSLRLIGSTDGHRRFTEHLLRDSSVSDFTRETLDHLE